MDCDCSYKDSDIIFWTDHPFTFVYCAHGKLFMCFPGNNGDDFFVLGLRNGRVLHKFNLGSGVATIVSDRLNHRINIHTVTFGRARKTGWLKVI